MSDGRSLSFAEHLEELRGRLVISIIALVIATLVAIPFADEALIFLAGPLRSLDAAAPRESIEVTVDASGVWHGEIPSSLAGRTLDPAEAPLILLVEQASGEPFQVTYGRRAASRPHYFSLTDPIYLILKAAVLMGLILSTPIIGWQLWRFVAPGLTNRERTLAKPMLLLLAVGFPIGAAFAYWVLRFAVVVLTNFSFGEMVFLPDMTKYVRFALTMMLAFGLVFEMPGVLWLLARAGLVTAAWLARQRRIAIVSFFLVAAFLTPPDVFTQLAMGVPLIFLYELSIWLARLTERGRR